MNEEPHTVGAMLAGQAEPAPVEQAAPEASHAQAHDHRLRHSVVRIRITDVDSGRLKVGLTIPAGLVGVAARLGARLVPTDDGTAKLVAALERGELRFPIVVDDADNGERIEIGVQG